MRASRPVTLSLSHSMPRIILKTTNQLYYCLLMTYKITELQLLKKRESIAQLPDVSDSNYLLFK